MRIAAAYADPRGDPGIHRSSGGAIAGYAFYERHGVPEYWLIALDHDLVEVRHLHEGRYRTTILKRGDTLASPTLPGLTVDTEQILSTPTLRD